MSSVARLARSRGILSARQYSKRALPSLPEVEVDELGVPVRPTWSVNELLSSYPKPTLSDEKFKRLHELSALVPPQEGTPEHAELKSRMEELIRLVEAVKLVDTSSVADPLASPFSDEELKS
ncbi:hypothetical protein SISNIDRAFT_481960 [Sistotremastrum niveocremeum HHB9708]|nr:hypothetical protein SISNIDRAFT_481960 [Sistotremastrum niveocremeum HHB9708]